ncbi:ABC transporter substrate-binding protein [Kushneria phosphatilytica]|uniref:ABC transporter substrate-binding protein n=2 Tax=Kushneria phosphatilytica TaxID=657387 RepID=A0A5C0ZZ20_9GAMM|nr:penicillin-binding protein activator [Kushneria phosphatilytica]QEL11431.1 ABC transporter substrate-binding protein [Kushneria phosphatilytica]
MRTSLRRLAGVMLATLLLAGCASTSSIVDRFNGPSADTLLQQARQQQGAQAAATRLQAAQILARQGDNAQALRVANELDRQQLDNSKRIEWALLTSRIALDQEDPGSALKATSLLDEIGSAINVDDRNTLRQRRGLAQAMQGDARSAAMTLIRLQQDTDNTALNDTIWQQLSRLDARQLGELAEQGGPLARGWVELAQLRRSRSGDIAGLFNAIQQWQQANASHPAARRLPTDLTQLQSLKGREIHQVAVFLPRSGPLSTVANALREGMEARAATARTEGEQVPELSFYDSASANLQSLYGKAMMDGAQVVIGPLDKSKVSQLETRSDVPIQTLALNYGTHDHNTASGLYEYGLSAEDEARQAAHQARLDGHSQAGIMVPDNDWGSRVLDAFRQQWQQEGGQIASIVNYDPKGSVASSTRTLLKSGQSKPDMLFLLALPDYARQIPPTLKYLYAGDLPVYATSHAYAGTPQPRLDSDLDGVKFVDIPWQIPDVAAGGADAVPFATTRQQLLQGNENNPGLLKLHAMGVDAFELARRLPIFSATSNNVMQGATGKLSPRDDGRIIRTLPWAVFRNGEPGLPGLSGLSPDTAR